MQNATDNVSVEAAESEKENLKSRVDRLVEEAENDLRSTVQHIYGFQFEPIWSPADSSRLFKLQKNVNARDPSENGSFEVIVLFGPLHMLWIVTPPVLGFDDSGQEHDRIHAQGQATRGAYDLICEAFGHAAFRDVALVPMEVPMRDAINGRIERSLSSSLSRVEELALQLIDSGRIIYICPVYPANYQDSSQNLLALTESIGDHRRATIVGENLRDDFRRFDMVQVELPLGAIFPSA